MRNPPGGRFPDAAAIVTGLLVAATPSQTAGPPAAPTVVFRDAALEAGLRFQSTYGARDKSTYILETTGLGAAFLDYDGDGKQDVFFANGATLDGAKPGAELRCALYRNKGDGAFEDVTERAGVGRSGWGQGVAVGDYDNDSRPDLYLTFFGRNVLFRNNGDGTFGDATARAGVAVGGWSTSAAFGDYDRDGVLDLYVARYVDFDLETAPLPGAQPNCFFRGFPVMCGPRGLPGSQDVLFQGNGDGTFSDVTARAGDLDKQRYRGLGVAWGDYDNDGYPDLIVANDAQPNLLFHNERDGTFREVALEAGVAYDEDGRERAGMGVDFGDYDNDGWLDVVITNFSGEPNSLYQNQRNGTFLETTWAAGIGEPTVPFLGWGTGFVDFDNDGWRDLFFVNGHVYPEVDLHRLDETYAQRSLVFRNGGAGRFEDVSRSAGDALATPWVGRGAAFGDYDDDGRVDVVVANLNARPVLLHNESPGRNHWLAVRLVGRQSNRDGLGARVTADLGSLKLVHEVHGGGSYLSQGDLRAHFGLGPAAVVPRLEVRWPSGGVDRLSDVAADRALVVQESPRR